MAADSCKLSCSVRIGAIARSPAGKTDGMYCTFTRPCRGLATTAVGVSRVPLTAMLPWDGWTTLYDVDERRQQKQVLPVRLSRQLCAGSWRLLAGTLHHRSGAGELWEWRSNPGGKPIPLRPYSVVSESASQRAGSAGTALLLLALPSEKRDGEQLDGWHHPSSLITAIVGLAAGNSKRRFRFPAREAI